MKLFISFAGFMEKVFPLLAPKESPNFTGNPTAPTPNQFDKDTSIATTGFVKKAKGSFTVLRSIFLDTTLQASDVGSCIEVVGGGSSRTITLPPVSSIPEIGASITLRATTTPVLTISPSSGDIISGSESSSHYITDYSAVTLTCSGSNLWFITSGNDRILTPPQFDNDTSIATTQFVQRALGNRAEVVEVNSDITVTAESAGSHFVLFGASKRLVALPNLANCPRGSVFSFSNTTGVPCTLNAASGDVFNANNLGSIILSAGTQLSIISGGTGQWFIDSGSATLKYSAEFFAYKNAAGYQVLPSGIIMQWGSVPAIPAGGSVVVTYPIVFPNAILASSAIAGSSGCLNAILWGGGGNSRASQQLFNNLIGSTATGVGSYFAIGY